MAKEPNVRIIVGKDENIEKALKKFKRLCEKIGIRKEVRARRYFEKPSEVKRRKIRKSQRNRRKPPNTKYKENTKDYKKNNRTWIFTHPKLSEGSESKLETN